jgi:hypothetical protein
VWNSSERLFLTDLISAMLVGVSVGMKWVSAPLLAWMAWQECRERGLGRGAVLLAAGALPVAVGLAVFVWQFGIMGPLGPLEFLVKARGCDLIPWLVALVVPQSSHSNAWIPWAFAPVAAAIFLKTRGFTSFAERFIGTLLVFSPSNHAWYFVWLVPFAVESRNLGTRLLSLSGFTYFWIWQTVAQTGEWTQTPFERLLLWAPFVIGFIAYERKLLRGQESKIGAEEEIL